MRWLRTMSLAAVVAAGAARTTLAEDGIGERLGAKLDQGITRLSAELRRGWDQVQSSVDKLGVEGRVYGRLHWDKDLAGATLGIEVRDGHVVVLSGSVPSEAAKLKAAQLTRDTVGVQNVVDELAVAPE